MPGTDNPPSGRMRFEIDPNVRASGNQTYAKLDGREHEIGDAVILFESEAGIEWDGRIASYNFVWGLVYFDVEWESVRPPSPVAVPAAAEFDEAIRRSEAEIEKLRMLPKVGHGTWPAETPRPPQSKPCPHLRIVKEPPLPRVRYSCGDCGQVLGGHIGPGRSCADLPAGTPVVPEAATREALHEAAVEAWNAAGEGFMPPGQRLRAAVDAVASLLQEETAAGDDPFATTRGMEGGRWERQYSLDGDFWNDNPHRIKKLQRMIWEGPVEPFDWDDYQREQHEAEQGAMAAEMQRMDD